MDSPTTLPADAAVSPEPLIGQDEILTYTRLRAWAAVHDLILNHEFPVMVVADRYVSSRTAIDRWWADMKGLGDAFAQSAKKRRRGGRGGRRRSAPKVEVVPANSPVPKGRKNRASTDLGAAAAIA